MRRIVVFILLLCLGLAGCDLSTVAESSVEAPTLPVPVPPEPVVLPRDLGEVPVLIDPELEGIPTYSSQEPPDVPTVDPSDIVPISELPEEAFPHVRGPAGTVRAMTYLGLGANDPVYGDVDGDGQTELVYWCYGPTSGVFTVGICVYGLEQGWPVLKGSALLTLSNCGDPRLEREQDRVIFRCTPREWDAEKRESVALEPLRLPVTLADGSLLLNGGALPDLIRSAGGSVLGSVGSSFSVLRERLGEEVLLDCPSCLVWQKTVATDPDGDPAGEGEVWTFAAVTDNDVTVTGTAAYPPPGSGSMILDLWGKSLEPIPPVEDPQALVGLTAVKLTGLLGPYHFDMSSTPGLLIPCWFTEDGKLLIVTVSGSESFIALWDMTAGTPFLGSELVTFRDNDEPNVPDEPDDTGDPDGPDLPDDPDVVTVHQEAIPTRIENEERWEGFLAAAERGEADSLTLRLVYEEGTYDLDLRCDGEVFTLVDEGITGTYRYLLASVEDTPRPGAKYRRAVHYLLSDDPDLTWEQYFSRMVSSSVLFDAAAARGLFSVFE